MRGGAREGALVRCEELRFRKGYERWFVEEEITGLILAGFVVDWAVLETGETVSRDEFVGTGGGLGG